MGHQGTRGLGLGGVFWSFGSEFADDEFLEDVDGSGGAHTDGCVVQGQREATVFFRVVEIGEAAGGEASEDAGVIWLPMLVVAFADEEGSDGVKDAGARAAGSFVEVARILFEERGEDGAADEGIGGVVKVIGSEAFGVALCALSVASVVVGGLLDAGGGAGDDDGGGIDHEAACEFEFLL